MRVTPKLLLSCASALLLASAACVANAASAVVHDDAGRFGYQMNAATPSHALHWAVSYCARHSPRCTNVVTTDRPGYSAIYRGRNAVGVALAEPTSSQAQERARKACQARGEGCELHLLWREEPAPAAD